MEHYQGRRLGTYDLVLELIRAGKLNPRGLLTHRFRLEDYKQALLAAIDKAANHSIKVAFDFRQLPCSDDLSDMHLIPRYA